MTYTLASVLLLSCLAVTAQAQILQFQHIIVVFQENRTPDNLFHALCDSFSCSKTPNNTQYNIQKANWRECQSPIECVFCAAGGIISGMHAEAVKLGARPSKFGLMSDAHRAMNCEECDARYCLHYDSDAEGSVTHWSLVAKEIIMAHHPHHTDIVVLHRLDKV